MSPEPVIDAGGRFGRRRRRRRLRIGIGIAALATVVAGAWLLITSSVFALSTVRVHLTVNSTSSLTAAEVSAAAQAPLRRPLIDVNVGAVRDRVAGLPAVAAVAVHRSWPHTLVLDVVARRPAARLDSPTGDFLVDHDGVVYAAAPARTGLPAVHVAARLAISARPQPVAATVVRVLQSLGGRLLRHARDLRYDTAGGLSFDDRTIHVVWGGPQGGAAKAAELADAAARRGARRPGWVDVSTLGVLVTRPAAHRGASDHSSTKPVVNTGAATRRPALTR